MKKIIPLFALLQITFALIAQDFNYLPVRPTHQIVKHTYYTLSNDVKLEQPEWVAYVLKPEMLHKVVKRKDTFRPDPAVKTETADYNDYKSAKIYDSSAVKKRYSLMSPWSTCLVLSCKTCWVAGSGLGLFDRVSSTSALSVKSDMLMRCRNVLPS